MAEFLLVRAHLLRGELDKSLAALAHTEAVSVSR
jgi:hypothetical protein